MPRWGIAFQNVEVKNQDLKSLLQTNAQNFRKELAARSLKSCSFEDLFFLSTLRKKAYAKGVDRPLANEPKLRLALIGACSFYPLHELIEHLLEIHGVSCELFIGKYDNYIS